MIHLSLGIVSSTRQYSYRYGTADILTVDEKIYYKVITCFRNDTQYITRVVGIMMIYPSSSKI